MKKLIITSILAVLTAAWTTIMAQDKPQEYLGLPGDNLNLYAVMKLFQESKTLEDFERSLNDENSKINNLDLNGDGLVDYITVTDHVDGNVHTIVLQDQLSQNEKQDVAVFTVQKFSDGSAQIQLVGDEDLYGKNYIIEPVYNTETPNPGYVGNNGNVTVAGNTTVVIADWPLVRFIFTPGYVMWHSAWYWGYYPPYWHPWRPFFWDYYYGYHYRLYPEYYRYYHRWEYPRYARYNDFYYNGIRSHSTVVINRIHDGNYKDTYSHPEQRRDGEALYNRTNHGQNSRRGNVTGNNPGRRVVSQPNQVHNNAGTRRDVRTNPSGQVNTRPEINRSSNQNTSISRRSSPSVTERSISGSTRTDNKEISGPAKQSKREAGISSRRSNRGSKAGNIGKKSNAPREAKSKKSRSGR